MLKLLMTLVLSFALQAQTMRGLYWMIPAPASDEEGARVLSVLKSNSYLAGVLISAHWNQLEPDREKYDFSVLDRGIAAARAAGKQYKLAIAPGMRSPEYIYADGAARYPTAVTNPNRSNYGQEVSIPVPWDPIYQKHFSRLIRKLGERYSSDPLLVGVTLTCANYMSAEMHLPKESRDVEKWKKFGLTSDRLLAVYKKYMDEWAAAFPRQVVCLHMSPTTSLGDRTPDEFAAAVALYGIERHPGHFALQRNTLQGRKEMEAHEEDPMFKYKGRLLIGYQSLASFRQPQRQGSVEMSALNFVRAGAQYWELWQGDGMDAKTCAQVSAAIDEARKLGYERYKQKLVAAGLYRTPGQDDWPRLQEEMRTKKDAQKAGKH